MIDLIQIPIGKFSLITQISQRSLRYYDEKGILIPKLKDNLSGYRYYTIDQIQTAIKIRFLTSLGFGMEQIEKIFQSCNEGDKFQLKTLLAQKRIETQIEIERLKKIEKILGDVESTLEILYQSSTEPVLKEISKNRVISLRRTGPYSIVPVLVQELIQEIAHPENQAHFVKICGPVTYICHENEFKETNADLEIAVPIAGQITLHSSEIEVRNLDQGWVLSTIYTGPYEEIGDAYVRVHRYILEKNLKIRDDAMELYLNNPMETSPSQLLTEIQIPIHYPSLQK